ncbi:MAG: hypothetical protein WAK24_01030, partial [Candidatus Acidiferrales bacterium]
MQTPNYDQLRFDVEPRLELRPAAPAAILNGIIFLIALIVHFATTPQGSDIPLIGVVDVCGNISKSSIVSPVNVFDPGFLSTAMPSSLPQPRPPHVPENTRFASIHP